MKKILMILLMLLVMISGNVFCQTTIDRTNIPEATEFYIPIGDRNLSIQNDLVWGPGPNNNYNTQLFSGDYYDANNTLFHDWHVYTNFNTNRIYTNECYTGGLPACGDYHPGEDWNGNGGGNTDLGQPIYATAVGRVIYRQQSSSGFGNMIQVIHRLPSGEYVISFYAHMDQVLVNEGDLVYLTTQIGTVGNSGGSVNVQYYAHLHWEIRQESFLDLTDPNTVSLKDVYPYTPNAWPGTNTTFIAENYYNPSAFIVQNSILEPCYEAPISIQPNSSPMNGDVCGGSFQQYNFPVVADGRTYRITVTPNPGNDITLFASQNENDINNIDALDDWGNTCQSGDPCASSRNAGDMVEIVQFNAPSSGVGYISWFSVYGVTGNGRVDYTVEVESWTSTAQRCMSFEGGAEGTTIRSTIPGMTFSTTLGYDWIFADKSTGQYNVAPYGSSAYTCNGNVFAWLGPNQGAGRIDFTGSTARSISLWTSTASGLYLMAYDENDQLVANDNTGSNTGTGQLTQLSVSAGSIAYVLIHDAGNFWLIDDLCVNDLLSSAQSFMASGEVPGLEVLDIINQGATSQYTYYNSTPATIHPILLWPGSEMKLDVYKPDGSLYGTWQSTYPPIDIQIENASPGEWQFEITAIEVPNDDYPIAFVLGAPDLDDTGSIYGLVSANGISTYGIPIDIFNEAGELVISLHTDEDGTYEFPSILNGTYSVSITPPLGFTSELEVKEITVRGLSHEVNFELIEGTADKLRHYWWWKIYLDDLRNDGPRVDEFTKEDVNSWLQKTFDHFYSRTDNYAIQIENVTYKNTPAQPLTFDDLAVELIDTHEGTYESYVRQNLLVNLLNVASGKMLQTKVVTVDGATASQAITHFYQVYEANKMQNNFEERNLLIKAYLDLRKMHMGQMIYAGIVPLTTPNVMYKGASDEDGLELLPSEFSLIQNYPNPFNPTTTISFSLPEASNVKLVVYNINGQVVETLADRQFDAGVHQLTWDGREIASGVYFYKIDAGSFKETKKMILLK